jgi:hypothetical protein
MQNPVIVGANRIRPLMIQINFPIYGTISFFIHSKGIFAHNLSGCFLATGEWLKKGECKSPLPNI